MMGNKKYYFYLSALIAAAVLAGVFVIGHENNKASEPKTPEALVSAGQPKCCHYAYRMDKEIYGNLGAISGRDFGGAKIYGGIVSHHFYIAGEIARFFATLGKQDIKNIVIIGPDHFGSAQQPIIISDYSYDTPWGRAEVNMDIVEKLAETEVVDIQSGPFSKEHSISTLAGFIKNYLPDTKIVPIIVRRGTNDEKLNELTEKINEVLPDNSVVVASVDFSHHLDPLSAEFHDSRSAAVINNFDYERLNTLEIDSSESVEVLLKHLENKRAQKMEATMTSSAAFAKDPQATDVTSYLFAYFTLGEPETKNLFSVLSFGDLMLGRYVRDIMDKGTDPFAKIEGTDGNFFRGMDFLMANLEGPVTDVNDCVKKAYSFKFKPEVALMLEKKGFNIFSLANNHSLDCKSAGFEDTKKYLDQNGINYFGDPGKEGFAIKEVAGKKVAFLGLNYSTGYSNLEKNLETVRELEEKADETVVSVHWGVEYEKSANASQRNAAHKLIDNGVDVIFGHHPHVVQNMEVYQDRPIFYSLGNFVFDQAGVQENIGLGIGMIARDEALDFYLYPFNIVRSQPVLMPYDKASSYCQNYTKDIAGQIKSKSDCRFELVAR